MKKLPRKDRTEMMMMMIGDDSSSGEESSGEESSGDSDYRKIVEEGEDNSDEAHGGYDEGGDVVPASGSG
jgi:hypothetical protein